MEEKERYEWNSRFDEAIKDNQTGDIVNAVEVLNKQDKRIKELEKENQQLKQQLAESEKKNFELVAKLNLKEHKPAFCILADRDCEALGQVEELQKQLHDLPKKIVEEIRTDFLYGIDGETTGIDIILDTILKKYGGEDE